MCLASLGFDFRGKRAHAAERFKAQPKASNSRKQLTWRVSLCVCLCLRVFLCVCVCVCARARARVRACMYAEGKAWKQLICGGGYMQWHVM